MRILNTAFMAVFAGMLHAANVRGRTDTSLVDAGETAFIAKELEFVSSQVYTTLRTPPKSKLLVPINSSVPSGAETFSWDRWDQVGLAAWISNYATDFESVSAFRTRMTSPIASLGSSYDYSVQDLRAALMAPAGNLDQQRAQAAKLAVDSKIDQAIAFGDAQRNLEGFLNNSAVPLVNPITGTWDASTTADELEADLRKLCSAPYLATQGVFGTEGTITLLLAPSHYELLNKPYGDNKDKTLLKYFLENNPYVKEIVQWQKLELADAGGDGPRAMVYVRDPQVVEAILPVEFEQFPPQLKAMLFTVICHARIGSVVFHHPLACAYCDFGDAPA